MQDLGRGLGAIQELLDSSRKAVNAVNFTGGRKIDEEATGISVKHFEAEQEAQNSDDVPSPSFGDELSQKVGSYEPALNELVRKCESQA